MASMSEHSAPASAAQPVLSTISQAPGASAATAIRDTASSAAMPDTFDVPVTHTAFFLDPAAPSAALQHVDRGPSPLAQQHATRPPYHTDPSLSSLRRENRGTPDVDAEEARIRENRARNRRELTARIVEGSRRATAAEENGDYDQAIEIYHRVAAVCLETLPDLGPAEAQRVGEYMKTIVQRVGTLDSALYEASILEESGFVPTAESQNESPNTSRMWFTSNDAAPSPDPQPYYKPELVTFPPPPPQQPTQTPDARKPKRTQPQLAQQLLQPVPASADSMSDQELPNFSFRNAPRLTTTSLSREELSRIMEQREALQSAISTITMGPGGGSSPNQMILHIFTARGHALMADYNTAEPLTSSKKEQWHGDVCTLLKPMDDEKSFSATFSTNSLNLRRQYYPGLKQMDYKLRRILSQFVVLRNFISWERKWPSHRQRDDDIWYPVLPPEGVPITIVQFLEDTAKELKGIQSDCRGVCEKAVQAMEIPASFLAGLPPKCRYTVPEEVARLLRSRESFDIVEYMERQPDGLSNFKIKKMVSDLEQYLLVFDMRAAEAARNQRFFRVNGNRLLEKQKKRAERAIATLRGMHPSMSSTKIEEAKIAKNEDQILSFLEAYSRMLEAMSFRILRPVLVLQDEIQRAAKERTAARHRT